MRTRLIAALALVLAGCGGTTSPSAGKVHVVAGENFWGDITRQLGGDHVTVTSIISDPNADPHTYETDPRDAAAISVASFVVLNGVGYDDFASKLLAASPRRSRTVLSIAAVVGVTGSNPNPHLWYDPVYVTQAARAIEEHLAAVDPSDTGAFQSNLQTFLAAYRPYADTVATIRQRYAGARIAYTERVPGYLVEAAGLVLGTPSSFAQSIEDGNDPSPSDTAAMDNAMRGQSVKVLLYNAQVTSPVTDKVKALATADGVPVVGVSETIPLQYQNFQTWQIAQAKAVLAALGG
ncbi:metal ABC transporter solute-binding protein [Acidothermaceae bacterium B102]|nr:metal ABC transporter solute-binding protein [Acidothermaceae bacterium B102]